MRRGVLAAFLATQIGGEFFSWILPHITGPEGPWLWVASIVLLLPGDLVAAWVVEKFLWTSGLSPLQLQLVKTVFEIAVNGIVWALAARQWMHLRARSGRRNAENPGS